MLSNANDTSLSFFIVWMYNSCFFWFFLTISFSHTHYQPPACSPLTQNCLCCSCFQFVGPWWQLFLTFLLEMWIKLHVSFLVRYRAPKQSRWAARCSPHSALLLCEEGRGHSQVCTLSQGRNSFCGTERYPRELRDLNSESLRKLTATENLKHRQIKRPCPKPVQEIASEMDIESSDNQTQDFFFFGFDVLESINHFLITRSFIKLDHWWQYFNPQF